MKRTVILTALLCSTLFGCANTAETNVTPEQELTTGAFTSCDLPNVEERGPIRPSLYIVGTFDDGQWMHMDKRKMQYKGDGIYQVVSQENSGNVSVQFATMSWNPQFTAAGKEMKAGVIKELKRGGFAKNTVVSIPEAGEYLWSIQITEEKKPVRVLIKKCN